MKGLQRDSQRQDLVLWAAAQVPQNPHVCMSPLLPVSLLPSDVKAMFAQLVGNVLFAGHILPFSESVRLLQSDGTEAAPSIEGTGRKDSCFWVEL